MLTSIKIAAVCIIGLLGDAGAHVLGKPMMRRNLLGAVVRSIATCRKARTALSRPAVSRYPRTRKDGPDKYIDMRNKFCFRRRWGSDRLWCGTTWVD